MLDASADAHYTHNTLQSFLIAIPEGRCVDILKLLVYEASRYVPIACPQASKLAMSLLLVYLECCL